MNVREAIVEIADGNYGVFTASAKIVVDDNKLMVEFINEFKEQLEGELATEASNDRMHRVFPTYIVSTLMSFRGFKDTKIYVDGKSKEVKDLLYSLGDKVKHSKKDSELKRFDYFYTHSDGSITVGCIVAHFNTKKCERYTMFDGKHTPFVGRVATKAQKNLFKSQFKL